MLEELECATFLSRMSRFSKLTDRMAIKAHARGVICSFAHKLLTADTPP